MLHNNISIINKNIFNNSNQKKIIFSIQKLNIDSIFRKSTLFSVTPQPLSLKNYIDNMKVSQQELMDNQVPLHVRDNCASIVIPLNK